MFNQHRIYRVFQLINFLKTPPAKSIPAVERFLETSGRTVYRYIDLLTELGFSVEKDEKGRLFLEQDGEAAFTPQETHFMKRLLSTAGKENKLSKSIISKLARYGDVEPAAESIYKAHLAKIVEQISIAILEKKQLLIKDYSSASSESIRDRIVEPCRFTDNYTSISAYEIKTGQNKYFNIERMAGVKLLNRKWKYEKEHRFHAPDCFGFQGKSMNKEIEIEMSMRAYLVLKDEFPMAAHCVQTAKSKSRYYLKANVQSFKAPGRFVLGMHDEIDVLGSPAFAKYVRMMDDLK